MARRYHGKDLKIIARDLDSHFSYAAPTSNTVRPMKTPPTTLTHFWKAYSILSLHPSLNAASTVQASQLQLQQVFGILSVHHRGPSAPQHCS